MQSKRSLFAPAYPGHRKAAEQLLALAPGHYPPPSRHQIMAENLIAAGERAMAMNPIQLAARFQRGNAGAFGSPAPMSYRAEAGAPSKAQPRNAASGNTVEIPVFPRNDRAAIPVPDPRELTFGYYEMPEQAQEGYAAKDQSRLRPEPGVVTTPDRNPGRVSDETFPLTVAPKGGRARPATHEDANQYAPWDSFGDMVRKTWQNSGRSQERNAEHNIWAKENPDAAAELARRYNEGLKQMFLPREQKHEAYVRAWADRMNDRYGSFEDAKETIVEDPFGAVSDAYLPLGRTLNQVSRVLGTLTGGAVPTIADPTGKAVRKSLPYMKERKTARR